MMRLDFDRNAPLVCLYVNKYHFVSVYRTQKIFSRRRKYFTSRLFTNKRDSLPPEKDPPISSLVRTRRTCVLSLLRVRQSPSGEREFPEGNGWEGIWERVMRGGRR